MINWVQTHWLELAGVWYAIDQILKIIAPLTPTKIDDNISDYIGKLVARVFGPKK